MTANSISTAPAAGAPDLLEQERTRTIIGAFYAVYSGLGFGFLESIYARALQQVLSERGMHVDREYPAPVFFRGQRLGIHRVDMLVDRRIIVEIKSAEFLAPTAKRQLRNYLTALNLDVGLVLHFGPKPEFTTLAIRR